VQQILQYPEPRQRIAQGDSTPAVHESEVFRLRLILSRRKLASKMAATR
jgi:hypothetical protein